MILEMMYFELEESTKNLQRPSRQHTWRAASSCRVSYWIEERWECSSEPQNKLYSLTSGTAKIYSSTAGWLGLAKDTYSKRVIGSLSDES